MVFLSVTGANAAIAVIAQTVTFEAAYRPAVFPRTLASDIISGFDNMAAVQNLDSVDPFVP